MDELQCFIATMHISVGFLDGGWEDPLEDVMATYPSILTLENPMSRGAWQATVHRVAELDTTEVTLHTHTYT